MGVRLVVSNRITDFFSHAAIRIDLEKEQKMNTNYNRDMDNPVSTGSADNQKD